jgi:sugar phosphate isomerase/epimerase
MNRRNFVYAAASGISAAVASMAADNARRHPMQYHLSCGAIGVKASQQQAIDYAAKYGFDCVDADGKYLASLSDAALAHLLDDMKARNVGWAAAGLPVEFRRDDAAFASSVKEFPAYAKALRRARVERVGTWILPSHASRTYLTNFRVHANRLRDVAAILEAENLRFGMEYVAPRTSLVAEKYPFLHTMAEMKELIAEINHPNVGIVLDSWHWYCAGDTAKDLLSLKASDVISVDLNDAPKGIPVEQQMDLSRELPAATGVIDVKAFLGSLKEIGYHGPVRAEPFNDAVNKMSADEALRATIASLDKAFAQTV